MQSKPLEIIGYIFCFIGIGGTLWISSVNLTEIVKRATGQYTFYSQSAYLSDGEAVIYFSCWTLLFIFISYLSVKNLIRKRYTRAIVYASVVILTIIISFYVDTLFYHNLY
jgi:hypothetical protein